LGRFVADSSAGATARRLGIMDEAQETVERRVRAAVTDPGLWTRSDRGAASRRAYALSPDLPTPALSRAHGAVAWHPQSANMMQ
jgi:hypothetical protein